MHTTTQQTYLDSIIIDQQLKTPPRQWRVDTRAFGGRVNLDDEWETHIWCRRLGCNLQQLREAVAIKGNSANALRRHFEMREFRGI